MRKTIIALAIAALLTGCAQIKFAPEGDDKFRLTKNSDACAVGSPDTVKQELRNEAAKLCAMRREKPIEIESDGEYGVPWLRCASATAVFRCEPPAATK